MIVLLKVILALICLADIFTLRYVFKDFKQSRGQEGYDELSIWVRLKFNAISFFLMSGMISLLSFLIYFIFSKITLG